VAAAELHWPKSFKTTPKRLRSISRNHLMAQKTAVILVVLAAPSCGHLTQKTEALSPVVIDASEAHSEDWRGCTQDELVPRPTPLAISSTR
jgi:hypothetical protein